MQMCGWTIVSGLNGDVMSDFFRDAEEEKKRKCEILAHIERYGVIDKDGKKRSASPRHKKIKHKKHFRYKLDLHGMTSDRAAAAVRSTIERCRRQGVAEILIVHGWGMHTKGGQPVLKQLVRNMLEYELHSKIRDFRAAPMKDGGQGATIVRLF